MKRFLSLLLALMMVLSLVACGSDGADAGSEDDANDIVEDTADDTSDEANAEDEGPHWWIYDYESWGEQKENPELVLFDGAFTPPLDLSTISDFAEAIFYDGIYYISDNGYYGKNVSANTDINEVLGASDIIFDGGEITVRFGEALPPNSYGYVDYTKHGLDINFYNGNDTDEICSMKEAVDNNWWAIHASYFPEKALGIYLEQEDWEKYGDTGAYVSIDEVLSYKIVEELGCPTHIHIEHENHNDILSSLYYTLFYEYTDFTIYIYFSEHYDHEDNEYDREICEVVYVPDGDYAARDREDYGSMSHESNSFYKDFKVVK